MERQDYLKLRLAIQQEVSSSFESSSLDVDAFVNSLMRLFLQSLSGAEVKRQVVAQQFRSFKRDQNTTSPSWAYKNPGLSSRLPTL